tara:strand:- start:2704 stop:2982 length:279 start_codon:yes stop_codon:yes gene_type:complete
MNVPTPVSAYRQIGGQHWISAAHYLLQNKLNCCIVSSYHKGWVYLIEKTNCDSVFRCMVYKVGGDPTKIKKELYNYTITNGNLIDASFISIE